LSDPYAQNLASQRKEQFEKAKQQNKIGKARAIGLELHGMYQTHDQKNDLIWIGKQLADLKQTVFLDRDGTLNIDDYVTFREEQFQLIPGVREGLLRLKMWGFDLVIISNQGGIGKGAYTVEDMMKFNEILYAALDPVEITPADFYFCPHNPAKEKCECRKPEPGLFFRAQKEKLIHLSESYMIGDKMSDILAAKRAGCKKTILVKTGITDDVNQFDVVPDYETEDLIEAARIIAEVEDIDH
jgi:D-glycero-D-manno-heptose 1,7-bisphosphate phosphatase